MENSHTKMTQTDIPVTKSGNFYRGIGLTSSGNLLTVSGGAYFELSDGSYFELDASTTTYGNYTAYSDSMYTATSIGFSARLKEKRCRDGGIPTISSARQAARRQRSWPARPEKKSGSILSG